MADALKDMYNETFLHTFGNKVEAVYPAFNTDEFVLDVMDTAWDTRKLKERVRHISHALGKQLPADFPEALGILYRLDEQCQGFPYLFFPDFVEVFGQAPQHWELAMEALARFTARSTSEFAIRPFLLQDPVRTMKKMTHWAHDENEHIRRLASEGCRPRLPWGQSLPMFKEDPRPVLQLLELLKADPSLYVRKSVANNLNDIAKDHPNIVLETAKQWGGKHAYTDWIIRRGLRTLVRRADAEVLTLFGYTNLAEYSSLIQEAKIEVTPEELTIGDMCTLEASFTVGDISEAKLRVEYAIDFVKSRGTSRKAFLLADKAFSKGAEFQRERQHSWKNLTTRLHYPGEHRISLLVNGQEVAETKINLKKE